MKENTISVLMSTYNGEKYVKEQIDSILAQKGDFNLELLVRDDGSTDKTQEILDEYMSKGKLNWYTGENLGPARSFYELIFKCKESNYYAFADQDDFWNSDKLDRGIKHLDYYTDTPSLYFSNACLVDSELNKLGRNVYKNAPALDIYTLSVAGGLLGCTMIFNNELRKQIIKNRKSPKMIMHDFYLALLCKTIGGKIIYDKEASMKYRQHAQNVVGVNRDNKIANFFKSIEKKYNYSIADQAKSLLLYDGIKPDIKAWLRKLANYKNNVINRLLLACSMKTKYSTLASGITTRISVFMGRR